MPSLFSDGFDHYNVADVRATYRLALDQLEEFILGSQWEGPKEPVPDVKWEKAEITNEDWVLKDGRLTRRK